MERRELLKSTLGFFSAGLVAGNVLEVFTEKKPKFDLRAKSYDKLILIGGKYDHCKFHNYLSELDKCATVYAHVNPEEYFLEKHHKIVHLVDWTLVHVDKNFMFRNRNFTNCVAFTNYFCYCVTSMSQTWWQELLGIRKPETFGMSVDPSKRIY